MKAKNIEYTNMKLKTIKQNNLDETLLIIKESFNKLISYLFSPTKTENVPQTSMSIMGEYIKIMKEEKKLINFLINHLSFIREDELEDLLHELEELNKKTVNYFFERLEGIEAAIVLADKNKLETQKDFNYITENKDLQTKACEMIFSKELVKEFLGYEDEFWTFIDARTFFLEDAKNYNLDWHYDSENNVVKMKLYLPYITDLKTALIGVKGYAKAHVLYFSKGEKTYNTNVEEAIKKYHLHTKKYFNI